MISLIATIMLTAAANQGSAVFSHPGLMLSDESISRMKQYIADGTEPAMSSYRALVADMRAQADYKMAGPFQTIARDGLYANTKGPSERDFTAAYYNALMYHLTGVADHRDKSLEIINAYSDSLYGIDGHDAPLCCLQGYFLVNAMELMRDCAPEAMQKRWADMVCRSFMSVIDRFEQMSPYANGNWGAIVNKMRMAFAIYSDNRAMYDKAVELFLHGNDNSALPNYIGIDGQCQETGRDQGHAQLGIGNLAEICEMAWNQGDDLWSAMDNRILAGYEYTAKYNLGYDVPFTTWKDLTGLYNGWTEPGPMGRGRFSGVYEIAYAHYVGRRHMEMPYTAMVLGRGGHVRPEKRVGSCDAIGLGSLLFYNGTEVDDRTKTPRIPEYTKMHKAYSWKAPEGVPLKHDYDVFIRPRGSEDWQQIDTYMALVNAPSIPLTFNPALGQNPDNDTCRNASGSMDGRKAAHTGHAVSEISYAFFDFEGDVYVKVIKKNGKYKSARIRPDYRGVICNQINDSTVTFLLFQPENVSVEFDGSISDNLLIFTSNPAVSLEQARKDAKRQNRAFVHYGPGYYTQEEIKVKSNTTYYLEGGAYFTGTFAIDDAHDVSILGRGIARPKDGYQGTHVYRSDNILIDGLILNTCPIGESHNVTLHDVRCISYPSWGDGLNVFGGCSDILYDRVFCRTSDDCTTAYATRKGFKGSVNNVRMINSTLWADVAHPIMIGIHGCAEKPDTIQNLVYENIDIICQHECQVEAQGCMAINCGDNNVIRNVTFDNIRVEQLSYGSLFHLKVTFSEKYSFAPGQSISDILFRNVRYYGDNPGMSLLIGYSPERKVSNVTFEGLRINGRHIYDNMPDKPRWYMTTDMIPCYLGPNVENVVFK